MRINELTSPYRELAEKRMGERIGFVHTTCDLTAAFNWGNTKEGGDFWDDVNEGNTPEIPQSSLDELREYENAKPLQNINFMKIKVNKSEKPTYWYSNRIGDVFEVKESENIANHYELMINGERCYIGFNDCEIVDESKDKLFTAAVAAMQGILSNSILVGVIETFNGLPQKDEMARVAFDYAEALIAEGKKRNHL